ncbi:MAG: hypothetical protein BMS9Abin20_1036 [Acidimicrobiia bacterium]|nr:MAG: hypothetical protein BMS9Abin20_1036 [Acidimicrobiia bacterium]
MREEYRVDHEALRIAPVGKRDLIIDYRVRVITTGLIVSWLGFIIFALWTLSLDVIDTTATILALGGFLAGLLILTFAPWRSLLVSHVGNWLLVVWSIAATLAIYMLEINRAGQPSGIGFLLVVFFAAATLVPDRTLITIGAISSVAYAAVVITANGFETIALSRDLLPVIGAIVFVLLLSVGISAQLERTNDAYIQLADRQAALTQQERELSQLYDVSRTIGAGTKLNEVLPELVGRVAVSVNARIGLVLLYNPQTEQLDLMSPIWVAGHTVHADDLHLALDEYGIGQRVFMSGDANVVNEADDADVRDRLVTELEADRVAAVALRVEDRTIGVLLVGDKPGAFTEDDLETLESVAAPAALVLNQMTRYEQARSTSERMAELAQMKTDFVSVVSHELRTPLTSIIGALGTLRRPELTPEDPRAQQLIEMAEKQSNRLRTLIEDLLVMSRIEADSLPIRPEHIDLDPFLADLVASLPGSDRTVYEPAAGVGLVRSDPDHLARVVTNLVDNAIKYGGDSKIEVRTAVGRGEVHVSVIDHGPGIPYEQHERIFERFSQLQPHATRSMGGAGLGLSIVRGLVEAMNGRVWYEPTVGGGATFTVAIPTA